jgi:hypothetical protein
MDGAKSRNRHAHPEEAHTAPSGRAALERCRATSLAMPSRVKRATELAGEDEGRRRLLLPLQPSQRAQLAAGQQMHARIALLDPTHMHLPLPEIDIGPALRAGLRDPQPVPERDQKQCPVPMAVAISGRRLDWPFDFSLSQILAGRSLAFGLRPFRTVRISLGGDTRRRAGFAMTCRSRCQSTICKRRLMKTVVKVMGQRAGHRRGPGLRGEGVERSAGWAGPEL